MFYIDATCHDCTDIVIIQGDFWVSIWRLLDPSLHTTRISQLIFCEIRTHAAEPLLVSVTNGLLQIHARLLQKHVVKRRVVPQVEPVAHLGLVLAVPREDVVVPLGAGQRGREPDLLVGGLLVYDVGADRGERDC